VAHQVDEATGHALVCFVLGVTQGKTEMVEKALAILGISL
jgi:hypothetical protein